VLDLIKFVEMQTQLKHCLKILSTPVYKINSSFAIKAISVQNLGI
jgi:hypothetical protein